MSSAAMPRAVLVPRRARKATTAVFPQPSAGKQVPHEMSYSALSSACAKGEQLQAAIFVFQDVSLYSHGSVPRDVAVG